MAQREAVSDLDFGAIFAPYAQKSADNPGLLVWSAEEVVENGEEDDGTDGDRESLGWGGSGSSRSGVGRELEVEEGGCCGHDWVVCRGNRERV